MSKSVNIRKLLINEVALEGLDGITLQTLWIRVSEATKTKLPFLETIEVEYWNAVRKISFFQFYELPVSRGDFVPINRYAFSNDDREVEPSFEDPALLPEDIYPHKLIHHADKDIVGSCATYETRNDITELALQYEYQEAKEKWGSKLVIVANQEQRNFALIDSYSSVSFDLTPMQYCILERIGRTRYRGEITQGPRSLQAVGEEPKSLFYHRKALIKHQLITKQIYYQKNKAQTCSGTLLHLRRYYIEQKSKYYYLTEEAVEFLKTKPQYRALYADMFKHLKLSENAKKLFKTPEFLKFIKPETVPYRAIYPLSTKLQWKFKNFDKERQIRVLQLKDPNADVATEWSTGEVEEEEEEEETGYKNYENLCLGSPLLAQAAAVVRDAGEYGLCQTELGNIMGLSRLSARALCRSLMKRDVVTCTMLDVGRQRVTRFVSRRYTEAKITRQFQEERKKLASLILTPPATKQRKIKAEVINNGYNLEEIVAPNNDKILENAGVSTIETTNSNNTPIIQQVEYNVEYLIQKVSSTIEPDPLAIEKDSLQQPDSDADELFIDEGIMNQPFKKIKLLHNATEHKINDTNPLKRSIDDQRDEPAAKKPKCGDEIEITEEIKSKIDKINVSIEITKPDSPKESTKSISDQIIGMLTNQNQKQISGTVTYRILHRANFIIECVRKYEVITDLTKLLKMIQEHEQKEGYMAKIDKKSLMRIIFKLAKDGHLKYMKFTLSSDFRTKEIALICDPDIDENHSLIRSEIDQAKMKSFIAIDKPNSGSAKKSSEQPRKKFVIDPRLARVFGFCPKFVRMRLIHEILFYLIYEHTEEQPLTTSEEKREWLQSMKIAFDEEIIEEMSPIYYKKELCWKTFLPPIMQHINWPKGWTLISDLLVRLPLEYFVKCCSVTIKIPELEDFIKHPIRQYFLICNLPPSIRTGLLYRRKYIFQVHDIVTRLCYIGLVQFGPQKFKEKDQVFIYMNKKTSILNTTPSKPSYHEITPMDYERHAYTFENMADVEQFWYDLWSTCMNTRLGGRLCVTGKFVVLEPLHTKQSMIDAMNPVLPEEAARADMGIVPGDGRGAAGLDSALFAHLRKNWSWNAHTEVFDAIPKPPMNPQVKELIGAIRVSKLKITRDPSEILKKLGPSKMCKTKPEKQRRFKIKQKTIVREVVPKTMPKRRKPIYDEIDKIALTKMAKLRTDWSPIEDHILLLCTTASLYMCPNRRRQIISFTVIRDILHRLVKVSESKTSRACQRRILYIMRNAHTKRSVNMCLEEIKQNENIVKKYKPFADRLLKEHINEHEMNIVYIHLVSQLTNIFSNLMKPANNGIIPNNMKHFNEMYRICGSTAKKFICYYKDPKTIQDIQANVIKTIIHSSMCCNRDKVSWAYQLFKVYQQYPEQLLRSVILKTRQEQLISIKKSYASTNRTNMPLSSSPYKLSIHYHNMLLSKIPFESFHDAHILLTKITELKNKGKPDEPTLEIDNPVSGTAIALMELAEKIDIDFKFEIPDDVIVLDQNIVKDKTYERVVERFYNILRDPTRVQKWEEPEVRTDSDDEDILPISDSTSKVVENPVTQNENNSDIDTKTSYGRSVTTRIAFHMMRAEGSEGIDEKSTQHMHDFFVVNGCRVFVNIPALENASNVDIEDISEDYREIKTKIVPKMIAEIKQFAIVAETYASDDELEETLKSINANDDDLYCAMLIINKILNSGVLGATYPELDELISSPHKGNLPLRKILKIMIQLNIILKTGTEVYRYVHFEHRKPWIIKTYKILRLDREKMGNLALFTDEMKNLKTRKKNFTFTEVQKSKQLLDLKTQHEIQILISPWIKIDGSVHRRVLDRWMGAVLIAILEKPGINIKFICNKFFLMKPVDLFTIIEYLVRLKCIKQFTTKKSKTTIFSSMPTITIVPITGLEDPRHIFLEPYSDALTKLTIFIGQKAYSLDFLRAQI